MRTPREDGFRMPAEFARHDRTLMAWPARESLWGPVLAEAKAEYAGVANAIAAFEPVLMVAAPGAGEEARAALTGEVEVLELPIDDSWLRDSGPIVLLGEDGSRAASVFRFNAWGERFDPYDQDARIAGRLCEHLGLDAYEAPMVLEGGSVLSDGEGTLLTTRQCLLNENRNPSLSADDLTEIVLDHLGGDRLVWLDQGLVEDRDTDGHVDLIAAFTAPGEVLLQGAPEGNPNVENAAENLERARRAGLEVTVLEHLPYAEVDGERVAVSYLNLYVCNGAVIVPVSGAASDEDALARIGAAFRGREVIAVPGTVLAYGGGGPHCITQQVPAAEPLI